MKQLIGNGSQNDSVKAVLEVSLVLNAQIRCIICKNVFREPKIIPQRIHLAFPHNLFGSGNWGPPSLPTPEPLVQGWNRTWGQRNGGRAGGASAPFSGCVSAFCLVASSFPLVVDY